MKRAFSTKFQKTFLQRKKLYSRCEVATLKKIKTQVSTFLASPKVKLKKSITSNREIRCVMAFLKSLEIIQVYLRRQNKKIISNPQLKTILWTLTSSVVSLGKPLLLASSNMFQLLGQMNPLFSSSSTYLSCRTLTMLLGRWCKLGGSNSKWSNLLIISSCHCLPILIITLFRLGNIFQIILWFQVLLTGVHLSVTHRWT